MIKDHAQNAFFASHADQKRMAELLDEGFDITFGAAHGEKYFWLAEPKSHMNQRFGLQQEILVIYSPQPKSDARILTSIEQISRSPDFRHRIDKVLFLVLHNGDKESTDALLESDADRVIIGITVDEILNPGKGSFFIRSKISSRFGKIDLFGMSSPIGLDRISTSSAVIRLCKSSSRIAPLKIKASGFLVFERQEKRRFFKR
ncbi:hypothetical protein AB4Y42_39270 [Paraburkholderia sp. EG286B]|uniref:hypothetical protein n=1 Tax=Paraburkholderia sp. EG286B TaxID=3237011 RepID=UPI0034D2FEEB